MTIDGRRVMELAIHVKLASEAVLEVARNLAELEPPHSNPGEDAWRRAMDKLIAMNVELGFMERILRGAVRGDIAVPRAADGGRPITS